MSHADHLQGGRGVTTLFDSALEAHDQAAVAVELTHLDGLETESFVERDCPVIAHLRVDHDRVGSVVLEDAANCCSHRLSSETSSSVRWQSDPDVERPRPRLHVAPVVRLFLAGVDELHEPDRAPVLLDDEQLAPRHTAGQFSRPVVPVRGPSTQSGNYIGVVVPAEDETQIPDSHGAQCDHRETVTTAIGTMMTVPETVLM